MTKLDELLDQIGKDSRILFLAKALMREVERQGYDTTASTNPNYRLLSIHVFPDQDVMEVRRGYAQGDWCVQGRWNGEPYGDSPR